MPIKNAKYTYGGINQDISKSKHDPSLYFEGQHIRITSEDSQNTGSVTNEKGTKQIFLIPNDLSVNTVTKVITYNNDSIEYTNDNISSLTISNNQKIIGNAVTKNSIILITTSEDGNNDCIWELKDIYKETYIIKLLYMNDLNLSINNPIQIIYNYENENNEKIYWVDGNNQLKFLNLRHSIENGDNENLIDLEKSLISTVGDINLSQPVISGFSQGGVHTAGMIQYAYNLYKTNLSQTTISPLTNLIPLSLNINEEGGDVNEVVGTIPILEFNNLDTSYTNIKIYSIKYNSLNEIPTISLISDRAIPENGNLSIYDDGNIISNISIEEFTFLGSNPIVPKHIESKDNQLFLFNTTENFYKLNNFDSRAYSFNSLGSSVLATSQNPIVNGLPTGSFTQVPDNYLINKKHDCINPNYNIYKYQKNGSTLGGEGKYLKYELTTTNVNNNNQFLKSNEIYRISIEFYNNKGQVSLPEWIADFIAPNNNLNGLYNILKITLKSDFYTYINTLPEESKPIGYRILRANRTELDKTILCQGIINPMIANKIGNEKRTYNQIQNTDYLYDQQVTKYPSFIRTFADNIPMLGTTNNMPLAQESRTSNVLTRSNLSEGFKAASSEDWRGQLFQFTSMMQMFTPDVVFSNAVPDATHKLKVKGLIEQSDQKAWNSEVNYITQTVNHSGKIENGISPANSNSTLINIKGDGNKATTAGIITPPGNDIVANYFQFYREFKGSYINGINKEYDIYGKPEVQVNGQGIKAYNNNSSFRYSNNYSTILQDQKGNSGGDRPVGRGFNSNSISSITIVEGNESQSDTTRKTLEQLYQESNFNNLNSLIVGELTKPESYKYEGNIYGGNNYESKLRTTYLPIGDFKNINEDINIIESPGDTYVADFTFTKSSKTNVTIASPGVNQVTEIVSFKVETPIDLLNRNDNSNNEWDNTFQPTYDSFQKYNRVYSQKNDLLKKRNVDFNFKEINNFGTTILATKKKVAGEIIDSWTDLLINETIDLDGKYGSINSTINFKDQIYTFQDKAVAIISINPRVQTQASDGISLELGTGKVLQEYKYITTNSGSINKWGVISGVKGIYYYDTLNKGLFRISDASEVSLSDIKGLRSWFDNNYDYDNLSIDNPLINKGVLLGYDTYNKDVYITLNNNEPKTRVFNEMIDQFIDVKKYSPNMYIDSKHKFIGTNDLTTVHKFHEGDYNNYFNKIEKSSITLLLNPMSDFDCIFNNIIFKSELYINGVDIPNETLTHIRAYNEHQDSGIVPLTNRVNIARKFRDWKALIPREGRNRMRNPWLFLELIFENESNKKIVLHDLNLLYTI